MSIHDDPNADFGSSDGEQVRDGEDPFSAPAPTPAAPPAHEDSDDGDSFPAPAAPSAPAPPAQDTQKPTPEPTASAADISARVAEGAQGSAAAMMPEAYSVEEATEGAGEDNKPKMSDAVKKSVIEVHKMPAACEPRIVGGEIGVKSQFAFRVCDPRMSQTETIGLTHWIYTVIVKTDAGGEWQEQSRQQRRYSDFLWLRDQLVHDFPGAIVPPLPEKTIKGQVEKYMLNSFELLAYRQRYLTKFLAAVGVHHLLKNSKHLRSFCQLKNEEWEAHKAASKRDEAAHAPSAVTSIVQKGKQGFFNVFKKQQKAAETSSEDAEKLRVLEERKVYAKEMEDALHAAQQRMKKHTSHRSEVSKSMCELSAFLKSTGELEMCADKVLGQDLKNSAEYTTGLSRLQQEQASKEILFVTEILSFYTGMYGGVRDEISRLQRMHSTTLFLNDEMLSAEAALRKASADKKARAEETHRTAKQKYEESVTAFKDAVKLFNSEWTKFHAIKERDFRNLHCAYADIQVTYAKKNETLEHAPIEPAVF